MALLVLFGGEAAMAAAGHYSVLRSSDGGRTWAQSDAGLASDSRINAFAMSGGKVFAGADRGLYISADQGLHWKLSTGASSLGRILSLAAMGGAVYAGTERNGVAASFDGGATWARMEAARFTKVRSLLVQDASLYAGTDSEGIFVSRNAGRSWEAIGGGLPRGAQVFSLAGLQGRVFAGLYAKGLYFLEGGAAAWRKAGTVTPLTLAAGGETLLAGHNPGGVFRSGDLGANWESGKIAPSEGLGQAPVWEVAAGKGFAIAGISAGIYRSEDGGRHWDKLSAGLPAGGAGIAFLIDERFVLGAVFVPTKG